MLVFFETLLVHDVREIDMEFGKVRKGSVIAQNDHKGKC